MASILSRTAELKRATGMIYGRLRLRFGECVRGIRHRVLRLLEVGLSYFFDCVIERCYTDQFLSFRCAAVYRCGYVSAAGEFSHAEQHHRRVTRCRGVMSRFV